jgi:hypothetical protein
MTPAEIDDDHWHWRWQYGPVDDYDYLHRIAEPYRVGRKAAWKAHRAFTVCGLTGSFSMPGFLSRMDAPRCPACCKTLKIRQGKGAPWNDVTAPDEERRA